MRRYFTILLFIGLAFWGCEEEGVEDTTPPTVTITFSTGNSVSEIVSITCTSRDNEGVEKVELWVNGVSTGVSDNTEPYSLDWNTTLVDNGSYTIIIRSYDTSGNTADSEPIDLTVENTQPNLRPINITSVVFDNGGFTITWNQSKNADFSRYELEKSIYSTMNSPSIVFTADSLEQTTYFDADVDPLIYQYYRVTVIDTFDYEIKGEIYSSSLDPVPNSVNVESIEYTLEEMTISWSESQEGDFKDYKILYSDTESGYKDTIQTYTDKTITSHNITEFNPNIENWYWVEVSDTLGQTSIGTGMTNSLNNQPTPVDVVSVIYDLESMTIVWEEYVPNMGRINQINQNTRSTVTNDFVSYELLQSDGEDGNYTSVTVITDQSTTSHSITEYDPTQENWFKVKVTDYWNLTSTGNGMTNEINSQTQIDISSVTYDFTEMVITWEQSSDNDFVSYELLQSDGEDGNYTSVVVITDQSTTSHSVTEYDPTQENWFKVKVTDYWNLTSTGNGMTNEINSQTQIDISSVTYDFTEMVITWEQSSDNDFVSYELLQSDAEDGNYTSVAVITEQSTTSQSLTEYDPTQENWFKVKVTDFWNLTSSGNGMTSEIDYPPNPSVLYPITYNDGFQINWSQNNDDDFVSYKLYESLSEDMINQTLVYETTERGVTNYVVTGVTENRYYQLTSEDFWGLQSVSSDIRILISHVELWGEYYSIEYTIELDLSNNGLTGSIPSEIDGLINLESLWLNNNQLTGSVPPEIDNLTNLTQLGLYYNQLTGEIPSEICNMTNLTFLGLNNNEFTGSIPETIGNLTNLNYLVLSDNQLTGEIPESICGLNINWNISGYFNISNNQLCPTYPSCIEDYMGYQDMSDCP